MTLTDGRLYEATIVGLDPSTDLAVVQIVDPPEDLVPATLGDSDAVTVGAPVMAVGNPLGLANTVTTGIVSALDRPVSASSSEITSAGDVVVTNAIQIDAAINPGNSGGPLFDAQGRVIGITSSIATLSSGGQSGSIGLGFAIPVNLAREVGEQLIDSGAAEHAFLGVSLSDGTATADGVTRRGAVIEDVTAGSPAEGAELQVGDTIVAIDGDAVGGSESLTAYVRERQAGDETELTVVRDGEAITVTVTLAARETSVPATGRRLGHRGRTRARRTGRRSPASRTSSAARADARRSAVRLGAVAEDRGGAEPRPVSGGRLGDEVRARLEHLERCAGRRRRGGAVDRLPAGGAGDLEDRRPGRGEADAVGALGGVAVGDGVLGPRPARVAGRPRRRAVAEVPGERRRRGADRDGEARAPWWSAPAPRRRRRRRCPR